MEAEIINNLERLEWREKSFELYAHRGCASKPQPVSSLLDSISNRGISTQKVNSSR